MLNFDRGYSSTQQKLCKINDKYFLTMRGRFYFFISTLLLVSISYFIVEFYLVKNNIIEIESTVVAAIVGLLFVLPLFVSVSFILTCFAGAIASLYKRPFSLRNLFICISFYLSVLSVVNAASYLFALETDISILVTVISFLLNIILILLFNKYAPQFSGISCGASLTISIIMIIYLFLTTFVGASIV
ncbi:MAG: hypothetical protein Q4C74_06370 [Rothia sp. (in: high G+C Gram-positive bacteria)]|nr:hypothetical protein [Rothia sp. (in: high G+C Gram-positive bacteria)]